MVIQTGSVAMGSSHYLSRKNSRKNHKKLMESVILRPARPKISLILRCGRNPGSVAMGSSHYLSRKNLQAVGYGSWGKTVNSVGSTAATTPTATDGGQPSSVFTVPEV